MSDNRSGPASKDFDARLREAQTKRTEREGTGPGQAPGSGLGFAFRIGTELVAGIGLGVAVGLGLDWWLETRPWFLIVFFFLGAGAGMLNVYRAASGIGHAVGYRKDDEAKASNGDG